MSSTIIDTYDNGDDSDSESVNPRQNRKVLFDEPSAYDDTDVVNEADDEEDKCVRVKRKVMRKLPTGASKTYSGYIIPKHLMKKKTTWQTSSYLNENFDNMNLNDDNYYDSDKKDIIFNDANINDGECTARRCV
jgi:hypothetical protein